MAKMHRDELGQSWRIEEEIGISPEVIKELRVTSRLRGGVCRCVGSFHRTTKFRLRGPNGEEIFHITPVPMDMLGFHRTGSCAECKGPLYTYTEDGYEGC